MSILIDIFAIAGVAWTVVGALTLALFLVPAIARNHRERRLFRAETRTVRGLGNPAKAADLIEALKSGSEGKAA